MEHRATSVTSTFMDEAINCAPARRRHLHALRASSSATWLRDTSSMPLDQPQAFDKDHHSSTAVTINSPRRSRSVDLGRASVGTLSHVNIPHTRPEHDICVHPRFKPLPPLPEVITTSTAPGDNHTYIDEKKDLPQSAYYYGIRATLKPLAQRVLQCLEATSTMAEDPANVLVQLGHDWLWMCKHDVVLLQQIQTLTAELSCCDKVELLSRLEDHVLPQHKYPLRRLLLYGAFIRIDHDHKMERVEDNIIRTSGQQKHHDSVLATIGAGTCSESPSPTERFVYNGQHDIHGKRCLYIVPEAIELDDPTIATGREAFSSSLDSLKPQAPTICIPNPPMNRFHRTSALQPAESVSQRKYGIQSSQPFASPSMSASPISKSADEYDPGIVEIPWENLFLNPRSPPQTPVQQATSSSSSPDLPIFYARCHSRAKSLNETHCRKLGTLTKRCESQRAIRSMDSSSRSGSVRNARQALLHPPEELLLPANRPRKSEAIRRAHHDVATTSASLLCTHAGDRETHAQYPALSSASSSTRTLSRLGDRGKALVKSVRGWASQAPWPGVAEIDAAVDWASNRPSVDVPRTTPLHKRTFFPDLTRGIGRNFFPEAPTSKRNGVNGSTLPSSVRQRYRKLCNHFR